MLSKYSIDYTVLPQHNQRVLTHHTNDPVEAGEFLMHLLASSSRIHEIRHEGAALSPHQSDHMIKLAAERLASVMVRHSLDLDQEAVIHRFGFPA